MWLLKELLLESCGPDISDERTVFYAETLVLLAWKPSGQNSLFRTSFHTSTSLLPFLTFFISSAGTAHLRFSRHFHPQSTPDNSDLQGKSKKSETLINFKSEWNYFRIPKTKPPSHSLNFIRLLRVVLSSQQHVTEGVITTRSNRMKFRLALRPISESKVYTNYVFLCFTGKCSSFVSFFRYFLIKWRMRNCLWGSIVWKKIVSNKIAPLVNFLPVHHLSWTRCVFLSSLHHRFFNVWFFY